jgi:hypothetical protein
MWACECAYEFPWRPEEGIPGASSDGNRTGFLDEQQVLLADEPSLQALVVITMLLLLLAISRVIYLLV